MDVVSATPAEQPDLDATLSSWIAVPSCDTDAKAAAWAADQADSWALATLASSVVTARVDGFLSALARLEPNEGFATRLVYLVDPSQLGATVYDVAFLVPDPSVAVGALLRCDFVTDLGSETVAISDGRCEGARVLSFGLLDHAVTAESAISGFAGVAVTRAIGDSDVTLVAHAHSIHLESLATSVEPLQHLLTSDVLVELLTPPAPSGASA